MAKATLELIAKTDNWTGGLKKAQSALHNFETTGKGLNNALAQNKQAFVDAVRKMGDMESKASTASGRLREMESMFMELGDTYHRMSARMKADDPGKVVLEQMDKLRWRIIETKQQMQSLNKSISITGGGAGFGSQFMRGMLPGIGLGAGYMAAQMVTRALGTMKDAVRNNIETNMQFEQSNANLASVLGTTRDKIGDLTNNAKQLGATTLFTANQITELQTVLARRGLDSNEILNMTHGISNLALATGTGLADSAELVAATMQSFGMRATDMEHIVSVLGVSTTKSALTMEKLGTSLQYVAPAARAAGFSLEDTVALLGKLVDNGINASTAGTSLRQIMLSMGTSSGKLAKALGGPVNSLDDLVKALKRLKYEGGNSLEAVSKSVRVTALPAFLALINSAEGIEDLRGELDELGDKLQEMADEQTSTLRGQVTLLTSAWDGLMLSLDSSKGILRDVVQGLTEVITKVREYVAVSNGGESALNVLISEDKRKELGEKAADFVRNWTDQRIDHNKKAADRPMDWSAQPGNEEERDNYVWELPEESDFEKYGYVVPYASAFEEADEELKKFLPEYEKLLKLDEQYSELSRRIRLAPISGPGALGKITRLTEEKDEVEAQIREASSISLSGSDWYSIFKKHLTKLGEDKIYWESVKSLASEGNEGSTGNLGVDEESDADKLIEEMKKGRKTPEEIAADLVEDALRRYDEELRELKNRFGHGLIDRAGFDKGKLGLDERVFEAYNKANSIAPAQKYADGVEQWVRVMKDDAEVAGLSDTTKRMDKARENYTRAVELATMMENQGLQDKIAADKQVLSALECYWRTIAEINTKTENADAGEKAKELAKQIVSLRNTIKKQEDELKKQKLINQTDTRILNGLMSIARGNKIGYGSVGIGGQKDRIKDGIDIPDKEWNDIADKLNDELKKRGVTWYIDIDFETGTIERLKTRLQEVMEALGSGTGGIKSIVSALDSMKKAGENMIDTLQGDADGWDKMMAVFNAAISPMEAMVTIYEAINALKAMSAMLSAKETTAKIADTAATTAHTEAEVADAAASGVSASASAAEGIAKGVKSVSWIPIVGAALGIAAAGGIAAAIVAANRKTEYHAGGGMVGGPFVPRGTDTVPAMLTPGEIILNKAQQNTLAPQLQPASAQASPMSTPYVTGEYIWLGLNNWLARTGKGEIVTTRR